MNILKRFSSTKRGEDQKIIPNKLYLGDFGKKYYVRFKKKLFREYDSNAINQIILRIENEKNNDEKIKLINEYFTFSAHGTQIGEGANARVNQENKYSSKKGNLNVIKMSKEYGQVGIDDLKNEQVILKKIAQ